MKKTIILCLFLGGLASCASNPDWANAGPLPSDYKKVVKAYIKQNFFDPYSMRDVAISAPMDGSMGLAGHGWLVCLQANSKNRMGGYIGLAKSTFLIKNDAVIIYKEANEFDQFCDTVRLDPWPEMENGGMESKGAISK